MSVCVIAEEQTLVLSIAVNPFFKFGIINELPVGISFVVLGPLAEHQLFKVCVIEDVGVHAPSCLEALFCLPDEAERVNAHQSYVLLRS